MKIKTTITPRKDGTVRVPIEDFVYVFKYSEGSDALTSEVEDEAHIAFLLSRGTNFAQVEECDGSNGVMPPYPEGKFNQVFNSWKKSVESGKAPEDIIAGLEQKNALTNEQKERLLALSS